MNKCSFLGRLTRDVNVEQINGTTLASFSLAISRKFKTREGKTSEEVNFLDFTAWDKGGDAIAKFFKKGDAIIVHAAAKQDTWTDKETQKPRSKVIFRVESFEFVPGGQKRSDEDAGDTTNESSAPSAPSNDGGGDDIPF